MELVPSSIYNQTAKILKYLYFIVFQEDKPIAIKSIIFQMKNIVQIQMIQQWQFHVSIYTHSEI